MGRDGGEEGRSGSGEGGVAADDGSGGEGGGREKGTGGAIDLENHNISRLHTES